MTDAIRRVDLGRFSKIMKDGWALKKASSNMILQNKKVRAIDEELSSSKNVLCHKLCGAGNGGFFLFFKQRKSDMKIPPSAIKVDIDYNGVMVARL
jgi:galactokinase/mevalonate kinase-like predicted kinase